ncbi:MAG: extracellular solute-binding protein [Planctomycetes bacterium]|nr:extracellular solute-binding protein [Planctomycetota bacterium]
MKKAIVCLAFLACALSALPAAAADKAPIYTITIHDLPNPADPKYAPFSAWFANHPNVRPARTTQLRVQTLERGSLMMSIAGGTAPDILRVYHHEAKAWIRNGFFEKLDKYIYKDTNGDGKYTHGVDEVIWKPFLNIPDRVREQFILEDGHIYILPRFQWIQHLVYRKDIFRDNGVDPEKQIETFDELLYVCRKLTDPNAKIPGARTPRGRKGFGLMPNGWIWQGYLYAYGGQSLFVLKTCPACGAETKFPQGEMEWKCSKCGKCLKDVQGRERADLDSPEARKALKLWQDMLWAPFVKCPHCNEPIGLGDAHAKLTFPLTVPCPFCKKQVKLMSGEKVITGCARPFIDDDTDWQRLWLNGEVAVVAYYILDWISESNVDSSVVGVMPYPLKGGASAYHYYGIYSGSRKRRGGQKRVDVCADMILDFCSQFYVPKDDPGYLKYEKEEARELVNYGFYNLCSYDQLVAAGLKEYANEIPPGSREMQRLIHDPNHYKFLPMSEGYSRVQQEVLGHVLLSQICSDRDYDIDAQLARANELANTQVFEKDEIVQEAMRRYKWPFIGALLLLAAYVGFLIYRFFIKSKGEFGRVQVRKRKITLGRRAASILLLSPAVLLILLWAYYPLIRGSIMAFQDVKVMGGSRFVGIENFVRVVTNPLFPSVVKATVIYVCAVLSLGFFAPVILAILLSEARRGSTVYRTIFYAPYLLGGVVVLFIWRIFYMPTDEGLLNHLISFFGLGPVRWLQNPRINKWLLAIPSIWAGTGSACLVYLAALKSIDDEMYEAADIDGAGTLSKVWNITLPCLKPLLIINFVGAFIGAFHGMGNILVLTGGAFETNVIGLQIFLEAFGYLRFGSATALAWILGSLLVGFTVYQLSFLRKVEFRRAQ